MSGFYLFKDKYNDKELTLIYHSRTKTCYLVRNEIIEIIYNPKLPSSYWCHLKNKYLKKNINIDKLTKNMKIKAKDNKTHSQKVISLENLITLINILDINDKENVISYINKVIKEKLYLVKLELQTKKIINKYILLGFNNKEIIDTFKKFMTEINDQQKI